jgi:hypothetical protein
MANTIFVPDLYGQRINPSFIFVGPQPRLREQTNRRLR